MLCSDICYEGELLWVMHGLLWLCVIHKLLLWCWLWGGYYCKCNSHKVFLSIRLLLWKFPVKDIHFSMYCITTIKMFLCANRQNTSFQMLHQGLSLVIWLCILQSININHPPKHCDPCRYYISILEYFGE